MRSPGHVVRMGGDEFLIIMPGASWRMAERLVQDVRAAVSGLAPFNWTVSTGMSVVESHDVSFSDAVERADRQLYAAKLGGRDRIAA